MVAVVQWRADERSLNLKKKLQDETQFECAGSCWVRVNALGDFVNVSTEYSGWAKCVYVPSITAIDPLQEVNFTRVSNRAHCSSHTNNLYCTVHDDFTIIFPLSCIFLQSHCALFILNLSFLVGSQFLTLNILIYSQILPWVVSLFWRNIEISNLTETFGWKEVWVLVQSWLTGKHVGLQDGAVYEDTQCLRFSQVCFLILWISSNISTTLELKKLPLLHFPVYNLLWWGTVFFWD